MSDIAFSVNPSESSAAIQAECGYAVNSPRFTVSEVQAVADYGLPTGPRTRLVSPTVAAFEPRRPPETQTAGFDDAEAASSRLVYAVCKRASDILISLAAMITLLPVVLITAIFIKLHDGGPLIFSQIRVGKNGRHFRCYKFRSMVVNAEELSRSLQNLNEHADQRTFKILNDPRVTAPGRVLRRFSIDEIPQLVNVLLGDMSIVGPRPPLPGEVALYSSTDAQRLSVKPGLTCIWQISGRSRLAFPRQVQMDLEYIRTRSLLTDFAIILRTVPAVMGGDGAA